MEVKVYSSIDAANPNGVIVTLFGDFDGQVRGWHIGPLTNIGGRLIVPHSSPVDRLLGAVAIMRALKLSQQLGVQLALVDPDDLWSLLSGEIEELAAATERSKFRSRQIACSRGEFDGARSKRTGRRSARSRARES